MRDGVFPKYARKPYILSATVCMIRIAFVEAANGNKIYRPEAHSSLTPHPIPLDEKRMEEQLHDFEAQLDAMVEEIQSQT